LKDFGACRKRRINKKGPHGPFLIQTKSIVEHGQTSVGIVPWPLAILSKKLYLINPDNTITAYSHTPGRDTFSIIASTPSSRILGRPSPPNTLKTLSTYNIGVYWRIYFWITFYAS
jgi:hypothetical protein